MALNLKEKRAAATGFPMHGTGRTIRGRLRSSGSKRSLRARRPTIRLFQRRQSAADSSWLSLPSNLRQPSSRHRCAKSLLWRQPRTAISRLARATRPVLRALASASSSAHGSSQRQPRPRSSSVRGELSALDVTQTEDDAFAGCVVLIPGLFCVFVLSLHLRPSLFAL